MSANLSINFLQPNILPAQIPFNIPILSSLPQQRHQQHQQQQQQQQHNYAHTSSSLQHGNPLTGSEILSSLKHVQNVNKNSFDYNQSSIHNRISDKNSSFVIYRDLWSNLLSNSVQINTSPTTTTATSTKTSVLPTAAAHVSYTIKTFSRLATPSTISSQSETENNTTLNVHVRPQETVNSNYLQLPEGYDFDDIRWIGSYDELPACDEPWQIFLYILYSLTVIIAVLGNVTAICVLVYDLTMATFSIPFTFTSFTLGRWIFGLEFCRVVQGLQITSVFVSVYTMMAIGVDRYIAIIHPLLSNRLSRAFGKLTLALIWSCGLGFGFWQWSNSRAVPMIVANQSIEYDCKEIRSELGGAIFTCLIFTVTFALPLGAVSFAYGSVALNLVRHSVPGNADEARDRQQHIAKIKIIKMLATIVILFAICWLPVHILQLSLVFARSHVMSIYNTPIGYNVYITLCIAFHWLSMANSFVNPIIYCFMSENFRSDLRFLWRKAFHRAQYLFGRNGPHRNGGGPPESGLYSGSLHGRSIANRSATYYSSAANHRLLHMRQSNPISTGGTTLLHPQAQPSGMTLQLPLSSGELLLDKQRKHHNVETKQKHLSLSTIITPTNGHVNLFPHPVNSSLLKYNKQINKHKHQCDDIEKNSEIKVSETEFDIKPLTQLHEILNYKQINIGIPFSAPATPTNQDDISFRFNHHQTDKDEYSNNYISQTLDDSIL